MKNINKDLITSDEDSFFSENYTHLKDPRTKKIIAHKYTNDRNKKYIFFYSVTAETAKILSSFKDEIQENDFTVVINQSPITQLLTAKSKLKRAAKRLFSYGEYSKSYYVDMEFNADNIIDVCNEYNAALETINHFDQMRDNPLDHFKAFIQQEEGYIALYQAYLGLRSKELTEEEQEVLDVTINGEALEVLLNKYKKVLQSFCISNPVFLDVYKRWTASLYYYPFHFGNNPALLLKIFESVDPKEINFLRVWYTIFSLI